MAIQIGLISAQVIPFWTASPKNIAFTSQSRFFPQQAKCCPMENNTRTFDGFRIGGNPFFDVCDGPFIIFSRDMSQRTGTGARGKVSQPVKRRVSFAERDYAEVEAPAVKENSAPKAEAACHKPPVSLSEKFSQRWGPKPSASAEVIDGESPAPSDIRAERPAQPRREKAGQTAESILQDIDLMVERVREICSKRPT